MLHHSSTLVSLVIGVLSAVIGGWFDLIVQRIVDAFGCIPQMLLLLLMMSLMGNGIPQMIVHWRCRRASAAPAWYALRRWPSRILVTAIT